MAAHLSHGSFWSGTARALPVTPAIASADANLRDVLVLMILSLLYVT
jgi:hypothetical protein